MGCCCPSFRNLLGEGRVWSVGRNRNLVAMADGMLFAWVLFRGCDFGTGGSFEAALVVLRSLVTLLLVVQSPTCSRCDARSLCVLALKLVATPRPILAGR